MQRIRMPLIATLATAGLAAAAGGAAQGHPAASAARAATVKLAHTSKGKILVSKSNFTLYLFAKDRKNRNACVKISGCSAVWPAYTVKGRPIAGPGVKAALLGTIPLGHGRRQVTYAGHALYTYVGDAGPKATSYIGFVQFGAAWDAVNAAGKAVK
jgi:predicted lipoprotein with Yx(FWY)xxD motif